MTAPRALYVHVPFCLHHCGYCDFTVVANRDQLIPQYLDCLHREMDRARVSDEAVEVETIFIGGGTPTHLSPLDLERLFRIIREHFRLSSGGEYSIEANPDGLCSERLDVLKQNGVNRISLGVQSFDADVLKTLERTHEPGEAVASVERAAATIDTVSLDLIFGVPGQSLDSWMQTLRAAMQLPIRHISTYGLTFESGTPFFRREQSGSLRKAPEELERTMYIEAIASLQAAGFEHYEVSNFARPGHACRHNQVYWNADEYYAFGPGAARYLAGTRSMNHRSVPKWLSAVSSGESCIAESETLSSENRAREAIMLALRMNRGLDVASWESRFDVRLTSLAGAALEQSVARGLLEWNDGNLRLTAEGRLIADTVVAGFL